MSLIPYWTDGQCSLFLGDCREVLPALGVTADLVLADPPYQSTSLDWDRWPEGWLQAAAGVSASLWCFGRLRTFLERRDEFAGAGWKLSHDIVWEKHNGSGATADRFNCVHEQATFWYRGPWAGIHHEPPVTADAVRKAVRRKFKPPHWGELRPGQYVSEDGGPRQMRSVIFARSMHGRAIHRTEKPVGILAPLIEYACPPGGLVVDPFAGSGSSLEAARMTGRRAIGIEISEAAIEKAARRLSQQVMTA